MTFLTIDQKDEETKTKTLGAIQCFCDLVTQLTIPDKLINSYNDIEASAQRVPEPDPLPGIPFDTRRNRIQFWKSLGSGLPETSDITLYFGLT